MNEAEQGGLGNPGEVVCIEVHHGSREYEQLIELRAEVLRKPLGLSYEPGELEAEKDSFHLGLWREGRALASMVLKPVSSNQLRLRQFAVDSGFQGTGLGRALLIHAESFASDRGYREIILHSRESAVGFYQKAGYEKEGDWFVEVGLRHLLMRKLLA